MTSEIKILIAEDEHYTREALVRILEQDGFKVVAAEDGARAIELYESSSPDLVCLDVMMPKVDGYKVCQHIRKTNETVPILFLTAKAEEIDTVVGLELGADDYVAKPFGVREILARIHAILRRTRLVSTRTSLKNSFEMAELEVFPAELKAMRAEREIPLSLRDLHILQLLQQHAGEVISRDRLYDHAWGQNHFANSRSLDQHISQLRKKVEADPANPSIIKTVHGAGYCFEP